MAQNPVAAILQAGNNPPSPFQQLLEMADSPDGPDIVGALGASGQIPGGVLSEPSEQAGGALSSGKGRSKSTSYAEELLGYGGGPLAQANQLRDARAAAAQQKRTALENAMNRIRDLDRMMPNPQQAWATGVGAPTRTGRFSEALSNANAMRAQAGDQQRAFAERQAQLLNELDLARAGVAWDEATAEGQAQDQRQRLAEQFMQEARLEQAAIDAAADRRLYQQGLLDQRAADRESREQIARDNASSREEIARNREARLTAGGGRGASVFEQKRQAYMEAYQSLPGMTPERLQREALEFAGGRRQMSRPEMRRIALAQAERESRSLFYTNEEMQARIAEIMGALTADASVPTDAPKPRGNPSLRLQNAPFPAAAREAPVSRGSPVVPASRMAPTQAKPVPALPAGVSPDRARSEAAAAIKAKPQSRAQILQRLQQWGVDTTGL